jgi:hypothetical protein
MGILNVTPDSFYDGGRHADPEAALAHARRLLAEGADLIDVGGESSRPGAAPISADEECGRVIPVVAALRRETDVPISIDTTKAAVAAEALTPARRRERHQRRPLRRRHAAARRRPRRDDRADAHARHAGDDASGAELRRRRRRGRVVPARAA